MEQIKTEKRPWGQFTTFDEQSGGRGIEGYRIRRIEVAAGEKLNLQSHYNREEHWIILRGNGVATIDVGLGNKERLIQQQIRSGKYLKVGPRQKHKIEAIKNLVLIEVQLGACDDDDVIYYGDEHMRHKE